VRSGTDPDNTDVERVGARIFRSTHGGAVWGDKEADATFHHICEKDSSLTADGERLVVPYRKKSYVLRYKCVDKLP